MKPSGASRAWSVPEMLSWFAAIVGRPDSVTQMALFALVLFRLTLVARAVSQIN